MEYVSGNVTSLLGWNREDFQAGSLTYAELIHPKDRDLVKREVDQYSLDPNLMTAKLTPYRVRTKSGRTIWVEEMTTFLRSEDGQVQGFEGFIHDVTAPKMREDIIRDAHAELTTLLHHCRQTITQAQNLPQGCPEMGVLLDALRKRLERYEKETSLVVVMAQTKAKRCKDVHELRTWKLHLIRLMYERGYSRPMILEFFRIIDWMIRLPEGLERQFLADVYKIEEEKKMSYITSAERFGIEKGLQQGMQQ